MPCKRHLFLTLLLFAINAVADEGKQIFVMNFDFDLTDVSRSEVLASLRLQGIPLREGNPFEGNDLGTFDYFFTVTESDNGEGRLTIEFYQYESHKKEIVISEIVSESSFQFGSPAIFGTRNNTFSIDLAFSIDRR